jgi:hypothetical protein
MKNQFVKFVSYSLVLALPLLGLNSCSKDACKDVECGANGVATEDGDNCNCVCAAGYEGTACETESRTKFLGTYLLSGSDNEGDTYSNLSSVVGTSSTAANKFTLTIAGNITVTATLDGNGFTVDSSTSGGFTYTGNGSFTNTTLTLTLNETASNGDLLIYSLSGNKQ